MTLLATAIDVCLVSLSASVNATSVGEGHVCLRAFTNDMSDGEWRRAKKRHSYNMPANTIRYGHYRRRYGDVNILRARNNY